MMQKFIAVILGILGFIGLLIAVCLLVAIPVFLLWNWLMPDIFGLKEITFLQSYGLMVLCGLLFKGNYGTKNDT
jgi:hypothetical protein